MRVTTMISRATSSAELDAVRTSVLVEGSSWTPEMFERNVSKHNPKLAKGASPVVVKTTKKQKQTKAAPSPRAAKTITELVPVTLLLAKVSGEEVTATFNQQVNGAKSISVLGTIGEKPVKISLAQFKRLTAGEGYIAAFGSQGFAGKVKFVKAL